jgi:hypothetical protein
LHGSPRKIGFLTACYGDISVPHPFALLLANGWVHTTPKARNHAANDLRICNKSQPHIIGNPLPFLVAKSLCEQFSGLRNDRLP